MMLKEKREGDEVIVEAETEQEEGIVNKLEIKIRDVEKVIGEKLEDLLKDTGEVTEGGHDLEDQGLGDKTIDATMIVDMKGGVQDQFQATHGDAKKKGDRKGKREFNIIDHQIGIVNKGEIQDHIVDTISTGIQNTNIIEGKRGEVIDVNHHPGEVHLHTDLEDLIQIVLVPIAQ